MKKLMFFAKRERWGEKGFVRVNFLQYLWLKPNYVTKIRWIKCSLFKNKRLP